MAGALVKLLRPAQWVKNLFVLGPLLFANRIDDPASVAAALVAFATWCAVASGVYVMNDVIDLEADRRHPHKRHRPLAAGTFPVPAAAVTGALLAAAGLVGGYLLAPAHGHLLLLYAAVNAAYSLRLKRVVLLDVMLVASGFVLRVLSGAVVVDVPASPWLVVCTGLLALFLGFAKRRQELAAGADPEGTPPSRDVLASYSVPFLDQTQTVLAAATAIAYTIYCVSPQTVSHVGDARLLATAPFVLHGLLRYLFLVQVRGLGENPTRIALEDPGILGTVVAWVGLSAVLLYLPPSW